jgi:hypothetical protein
MTMLAHTGGAPGRTADSPKSRDRAAAGLTAAYPAIIKRLFIRVLTMLAAGAAVAAIMALKIAIYLPRLIHH